MRTKAVLFVGSAISAVEVVAHPDDAKAVRCVPGVPEVKQAIITGLKTSIRTHGDQTPNLFESLSPVELERILARLGDDSTPSGFLYSGMAYEALIECIWDTDPSLAREVMLQNFSRQPNLNHYAAAKALLDETVATIFKTDRAILMTSAMFMVRALIPGWICT